MSIAHKEDGPRFEKCDPRPSFHFSANRAVELCSCLARAIHWVLSVENASFPRRSEFPTHLNSFSSCVTPIGARFQPFAAVEESVFEMCYIWSSKSGRHLLRWNPPRQWIPIGRCSCIRFSHLCLFPQKSSRLHFGQNQSHDGCLPQMVFACGWA